MTAVAPRPAVTPAADPARLAGYGDAPARLGFFTDTSVCIGCRACEVACEEWNGLPPGGEPEAGRPGLDGDHWRRVWAVAQPRQLGTQVTTPAAARARLASEEPVAANPSDQRTVLGATAPAAAAGPPPAGAGARLDTGPGAGAAAEPVRWLLFSDVCAHCTRAACLDVCPTGALFRSEFGTVVVQDEVCNGCGACVPACPYGVIGRRTPAPGAAPAPSGHGDRPAADRVRGTVGKCTLCYDRTLAGVEPACAKACPTDAIRFGPLDDLRARADERLRRLHAEGVAEARLHGRNPEDGVGGAGAFWLLLDEPEVYGLPPDPVSPTDDLPAMWRAAGWAVATMVAAVGASFALFRR